MTVTGGTRSTCSVILASARRLFPFNRARWLRRIVVDDPVDALHLIDDAGCDPAEECGVERINVRGHAIERGDRTKAANIFVGAVIAHDSDRSHGKQHRERLPDRIIEASVADLLEIDGVRLAQDVAFFLRDLSRTADRETRSREWMAAHESVGKTELTTQLPHLILEQLAQRLDELHVHALGQAADVVVTL